MNRLVSDAFEHEWSLANAARSDGALDRAHILGQRSTRLHVRSDLGMLGIARQRRLNCRQSSTRTEAELVRLRTATLDWLQCCPSVHP